MLAPGEAPASVPWEELPDELADLPARVTDLTASTIVFIGQMNDRGSAPSNRDYEGGFAVAMMLKDLKLAQEAAAKSGASTPLGTQAEALYALFDRLGAGGKDFSAILEMFRGRLTALKP